MRNGCGFSHNVRVIHTRSVYPVLHFYDCFEVLLSCLHLCPILSCLTTLRVPARIEGTLKDLLRK